MNASKLLEEVVNIEDNYLPVNKKNELKLCQELLRIRQEFLKIKGIAKINPDYLEAAKIHNNLMHELLLYNPNMKERFPSYPDFIYF